MSKLIEYTIVKNNVLFKMQNIDNELSIADNQILSYQDEYDSLVENEKSLTFNDEDSKLLEDNKKTLLVHIDSWNMKYMELEALYTKYSERYATLKEKLEVLELEFFEREGI